MIPDREDSLEKGMATQSSILPRRIPWTEEPCGYSPWGCKELDMTEKLTHTFKTGNSAYLFCNCSYSKVWYNFSCSKNQRIIISLVISQSFTDNKIDNKTFFHLVAQSCPTLCNPADFRLPGFPVHHQNILKIFNFYHL